MNTEVSLWNLCLKDLDALEELIILFLHSRWRDAFTRLQYCSIFG